MVIFLDVFYLPTGSYVCEICPLSFSVLLSSLFFFFCPSEYVSMFILGHGAGGVRRGLLHGVFPALRRPHQDLQGSLQAPQAGRPPGMRNGDLTLSFLVFWCVLSAGCALVFGFLIYVLGNVRACVFFFISDV